MRIIVRSLNFEAGSISLELVSPLDIESRQHFGAYLKQCRRLGLRLIDVSYHDHLPVRTAKMLKEAQKRGIVRIVTPISRSKGLASSKTGDFRLDREGVYSARCRVGDMSLARSPELLNRFVLAIANSCPLETLTLSYLRLCVYELAVNTAEHGTFGKRPPRIHLELRLHKDWVGVVYRDNADPFNTVGKTLVDVARKIRQRSKRGLGLFMINEVTEDISYERNNGWNCTTLKITRQKDAREIQTRRSNMEDFSLEVINTSSSDHVILRPKGSINSATTPEMDSELNKLMSEGKFNIIVDLSQTEFISSSGVGVFLGTVANLRSKGGDLILMRIPQLVDDILDILNIKEHFRVIERIDELQLTVDQR